MCRYVVKDEEALGYIFDEQPTTFGFLSGGAGREPTSIILGLTSIRPATTVDFERFRVSIPPDFIQGAFDSFCSDNDGANPSVNW